VGCATKRNDVMGGNPLRLYRQALSPWGVAAGGCKPAVKELPLKGTREARCKPPRSGAWLRKHMARKRMDERPTGNGTPASRPCTRGQRPHPMADPPPKDVRGGHVSANRISEVNLNYPLIGRDSTTSGLGHSESTPTCFRRVHHCERGRLACGGEQSTSETGKRRRRHSTRRTGKPSTGGRTPGD
jgi:hypothetical protein